MKADFVARPARMPEFMIHQLLSLVFKVGILHWQAPGWPRAIVPERQISIIA
jgi:hypothetical protein